MIHRPDSSEEIVILFLVVLDPETLIGFHSIHIEIQDNGHEFNPDIIKTYTSKGRFILPNFDPVESPERTLFEPAGYCEYSHTNLPANPIGIPIKERDVFFSEKHRGLIFS
jgi:hypothetical protein